MKIYNKESGSASMVGIVGIGALTIAAFFAKDYADRLGSSVRAAKLSNLSEEAKVLSVSNLAILRSLMSDTKVATDLYEPAIFPDNYFSEKWRLQSNPLLPQVKVKTEGEVIRVKNVPRASSDALAIEKTMKGGTGSDITSGMQELHELKILNYNPEPGMPYYISSVDVKAKVKVAESVSDRALSKVVEVVGRIDLKAPRPNGIDLQIRPSGSTAWTTNFGTQAAPLPAGNYDLLLKGGGVVYKGRIETTSGWAADVGVSDAGITHSAVNIHQRDVEIGIASGIPLGENKIINVELDPIQNTVSVSVPVPTASTGAITDPRVYYNSGSCRFSSGPATPALPTGPVPAPPSSGPSTSSSTSTATSSTSVTTVPEEVEVKAFLVGVDQMPYEKTIAKKMWIRSTVTTNTIQKTITSTNTSYVGTPTGGNTNDGQSCSTYCPKTTADATGPGQWDTMWPYASKGDAVSTKMRDFVEYNNGYNGLPITGVSCVNYDLTAQKIMQATGAPSVDAIRYANNAGWWATFDQMWGGGGAKNLERYVAYVLPSCQRQIVGTRDACGCFDEHTQILMGDGTEKAVKDIRSGDHVWNPKSKRPQPVKRVIAGPEKEPLYRIQTAGQTVTVTSKHPFLSAEGLKAARDFKIGDILVDDKGPSRVEAITQIVPELGQPFPTVWNFELEGGAADEEHYVIANGVMTGDLYLQIKLENELSRVAKD